MPRFNTSTGMTMRELRQIAIGAARSELRRIGKKPERCAPNDALAVLDDLARIDSTVYASRWYNLATDYQINEFKREWRRWTRNYIMF